MKTTYIYLVLAFSMLTNLYAQDAQTANNKSNAGLKFGYNLAAVSFDGDTETGQRHGFHAGFYGESFATNNLAFQVEILYAQQGYEVKDNSGTFTQKLDYINMPLLLKLYPSNNFFLEAGPQIGLAISHKEEFDSSFNLFDTEQKFNPNRFDWGMNFGGGVKTDSGVSFGVRYHLGLGDIYDDGNPRNRVWQFSLGFDF